MREEREKRRVMERKHERERQVERHGERLGERGQTLTALKGQKVDSENDREKGKHTHTLQDIYSVFHFAWRHLPAQTASILTSVCVCL